MRIELHSFLLIIRLQIVTQIDFNHHSLFLLSANCAFFSSFIFFGNQTHQKFWIRKKNEQKLILRSYVNPIQNTEEIERYIFYTKMKLVLIKKIIILLSSFHHLVSFIDHHLFIILKINSFHSSQPNNKQKNANRNSFFLFLLFFLQKTQNILMFEIYW